MRGFGKCNINYNDKQTIKDNITICLDLTLKRTKVIVLSHNQSLYYDLRSFKIDPVSF